jgi:ketosteroid isomerase-like protein
MKNSIFLSALMLIALSTMAQPNPSPEVATSDPAFVMKEFFDAYRAHDHNKITSMIHPEVMWTQPGANRLSGIKKSREEVMAMGKIMAQLSDKTIQLAEIKILNSAGNSVACLLRWKAAQPTGATLDVENIDVYTIESGKIVAVKIFSADIEQENNFWGK